MQRSTQKNQARSIRWRILLPFVLILISFGTLGYLGYRQILQLTAHFNDVFQNRTLTTEHLSDAKRALWEIILATLTYPNLPEVERQRTNQQIRFWEAELERKFTTLELLLSDKADLRPLKEWQQAQRQYQLRRKEFLDKVEKHAPIDDYRSQILVPSGLAALDSIDKVNQSLREPLVQRGAQLLKTAQESAWMLLVSLTVGFVFSVAVAAYTYTTLFKQLKALKDNEFRFQTQYDNFPVPTYSWKKQGDEFIMVEYNLAADRMTQGKIAALKGRTAATIFPDKPELIEDLNRCLHEQRTFQREYFHHLRATGEDKYFITTYVFAPPDMVMAHTEDITEKIRAQKTVDQERARALYASKMATLGEMASGIAHEINNPLAIIHGYASHLQTLVSTKNYQPDTLEEFADTILKTCERISKIVKGLRSFARDGATDPFQQVNLANIIQDTLDFCQMRFRSHEVELRVKSQGENCQVACRPVQISQIIINLLNNSLDAVDDLSERWVELDVNESTDKAQITVTDSGTGIPEPLRQKIMQPFFTTKELGQGTGLGLSISTGIAEAHGGRLYVDSESPHTKFVLELPKNLAKPQAA